MCAADNPIMNEFNAELPLPFIYDTDILLVLHSYTHKSLNCLLKWKKNDKTFSTLSV